MKIIAFTGMPFSGKTEAVKVTCKMKINVIRMGDLVWEEVKKRDLELNDKNVGFIANKMRKLYGNNVWAIKTIEKIKLNNKSNLIVVDGIRNIEEVDIFKEKLDKDFTLIAIVSNDELRYNRGLKRGRKDDSSNIKILKKRDEREIKWGIKKVIESADIVVKNDGALKDFKKKIIDIIDRLLKNDKLIN
jgi:dephospho-CoA kinase